MTILAFNSISRSCAQAPRFRKRWLHQSFARQAIMMPSMSPFMTEGTITCWAKKEGEAFKAGDILLQIESDVANAMVDVKAETAGILGKILLPDGSTNVPVEQVIALVARNESELQVQTAPDAPEVPTPPPFNPLPSPPSRTISSPAHAPTFSQPFLSPTLRTSHLFEASASHAHHHGMATRQLTRRASDLTIVPPSPSVAAPSPLRSVYSASTHLASTQPTEIPPTPSSAVYDRETMDGATLRRMIVFNLTRTPSSAAASNNVQQQRICDTTAYFEGIL